MDESLAEWNRYIAQAASAGVSEEVATAEYAAVREELAAGHGDPGEAIGIAWRRLTAGGPAHRPGDKIRADVRDVLPGAHPELIDEVARHYAPEETLAAELGQDTTPR